MKKEKKDHKTIIIILLSVILVLLFIVIFLFIGREFDDDRNHISPVENNQTLDSSSSTENTEDDNSISTEEALQIALDHFRLQKNDIYDLSIESDYKYNAAVYEVDFSYHYYDYEVIINKKTKKILHAQKERD